MEIYGKIRFEMRKSIEVAPNSWKDGESCLRWFGQV